MRTRPNKVPNTAPAIVPASEADTTTGAFPVVTVGQSVMFPPKNYRRNRLLLEV